MSQLSFQEPREENGSISELLKSNPIEDQVRLSASLLSITLSYFRLQQRTVAAIFFERVRGKVGHQSPVCEKWPRGRPEEERNARAASWQGAWQGAWLICHVFQDGGAGARGTPVGGQWSHGWPTASLASTAHRSHGARGEYTRCNWCN